MPAVLSDGDHVDCRRPSGSQDYASGRPADVVTPGAGHGSRGGGGCDGGKSTWSHTVHNAMASLPRQPSFEPEPAAVLSTPAQVLFTVIHGHKVYGAPWVPRLQTLTPVLTLILGPHYVVY